ncbi:NAD(P)-dependent oxidoreductase [Pantoea sp. 18069]|uniref:NAD(P)-dependent oxidoreductase n=1 Tax=Pantoea sp. 18069 TaxID=2681415 RepID=UPI00135A6107|nr:NAD(P)-dependent oxidoreductase [Pantoea sp. 18069]
MTLPHIGFIGIGLMGEAMTLRLRAQGYGVTVWNREPRRLDAVIAAGATRAATPVEVAQHSDIVLLCVLDDAAVEHCTRGPEGLATRPACRARLVIDFSTISPETTRTLAEFVSAQAGMQWLDAPVSGGPEAARSGQLTIMVGGRAQDFAQARTVLDALGSQVTHMGPSGAGQTAKIINQAIVGAGFVLMSEAALLAEAAGMDAAQLPACLQGGFADSTLLQKVYPRIHARAFEPPIGYARQLSKDMQAVAAFAQALQCELPLVNAAARRFAQYVDAGAAMADSASLIRLYESEAAARQAAGEGAAP